ncbi:hypothetical protein BWD42_07720 [Sphingobacterium sp. CZ-UAM]|uniref:hypothetical protein n=1 Tax=Sphingobacterium sp. CZ-UAM TaxID=1933868 RepID=UPI000985A49B|nr:hypothetical protein [Sphingobacterium sp. CZ-UAM]OOG19779.1 hypothetical protein BWD42_07720 [Sphingobacterium sp. CZ-UAM]
MKKRNYVLKSFAWIGFLTVLFSSCSSDKLEESMKRANNVNQPAFVTNPKNLNIIYFIPKDQIPDANYKKRLSDLFIYFQKYIKSEMERYGFENTNLGLPVDSASGLVKFIEIRGKEDISAYPYSGGDKKIKNEIFEYKILNPNEFSSNYHTFVITLDNREKKDVPYYGPAGFAFGIDFNNLKVENIGNRNLVGSYVGGNLHEMIHGLTLLGENTIIHESGRISEQNTLGNTLMGTGNGTLGYSPTYISYPFAAILNRVDVFQKYAGNIKFYEKPNANITTTRVDFNRETQAIELEGIIDNTTEISNVFAFCRELPHGGGSYDVGFKGDLAPNGFRVSIPITDLQTQRVNRTGYTLVLKALFKNGAHIDQKVMEFKAENNNVTFDNDVYVYQNCTFGGYKVALKTGNYTKQDLINLGIKDNDISAIFIPELLGIKVTLYDDDNFSGESFSTTKSIDCKFNDRTTSIKIEKLTK